MGTSESKPAKDIEFDSLTLVKLKNGKFHIDPEIGDFYGQTMALNTDYKVAIISAVGPPDSGKTALLLDAMYSLIPKKELDKGRNVKYNRPKQFTDPRLLLITSSVSLREKNSNLVVFGLDIDAGDYNREVYDKLTDFAISISSVTLVSLSVRFDPTFWDCEQTFLKVFQGPRLQTAGIVIFQQNSKSTDREPLGITKVPDYLQRQDVHSETKKAVQIISSSYNYVQLAFLPIPNPSYHRFALGSWHYVFFSYLFSTMEPVKRYTVPWDFTAFKRYLSRVCRNQSEPMSHPSTESNPTLYLQTPVASTSTFKPRPTYGSNHDDNAYLTAYDAKFQRKQQQFLSASNPFLTIRQLERIHQEITAELWTYFEAHGGPSSLDTLLANCLQSYSNQRNELEKISIKVRNEFQSAFLECKYRLSLQLLNPAMDWNEFLSKVNSTITNILEKKRGIPTNSSHYLYPYFQSLSKDFYSDVCLLIDMIQFFQASIASFSNRNICVPEEELLRTIERIRIDTFKQGTFISTAGNADFPKLIDNFIDNHFKRMHHINKGRASLEKHLIDVAIEKLCAKFQTTLSTYTCNRILTDYQLDHLRDQLFPAAENAFLLKRTARGFKFPRVWESSKSQLQAGLLKEYEKIRIQNQEKLQQALKKHYKPNKLPLPISPSSLSPPNPNQSALPTTAHSVIKEGATNFSTTPMQTPPSLPSKPDSSGFCIHIKESEFTISWTIFSITGVKTLPPIFTISNGLAIPGAFPPSHPSDSQVLNIFHLLSNGLSTSQDSPYSAKLPTKRFNYAEEIIALFFRQAVSSIPELEHCQRRCVVITSAATLPDARARLKSSTVLADLELVRILNPTTALCLSYYYNFLDHPKLPQDHDLFLLVSEDGKFEIQLAKLTAKFIVTSNAKIILARNGGETFKDFYQLLFEHYFPSTTYHNPDIIGISITSPALLLQNSTIQINPKNTAYALYRGALAWMSSEPGGHDDLQIIQSLAVSVQVSLPSRPSEHQNIWLNAPRDGNPLWWETELYSYDHVIFLYQLRLGFPPAIPISQPKKLKITLPDSDPGIPRKLKAGLDSNGCLDFQLWTDSTDNSSAQLLKTLHFENFMPPDAISAMQLQPTSLQKSPELLSFPSNSNDIFANHISPSSPLGPPPPIPTNAPVLESPLQTTTAKTFQSPREELEALIVELQARSSKATLSRAAKKLLEKRIEDATSRLNSPDNSSQQIQAALRSLQATEKAFDDSEDSD